MGPVPFVNSYIPCFIQRLWYLFLSFFRETSRRTITDVLEIQPPRLFALIIGIDRYQSFSIPALRGAVSDANAVQDYLQKYLAVPSSQIRIIRDSEATRATTLHAIDALTTDDRLQRGDPLIFYAGHGSTAPTPAGWEIGDPEIQLLVPHDHLCDNSKGGKVYGIPDGTLAALLGRLVSAKGDNITVILDCCYSGSKTRVDKASSLLVRGIDTKEEIPANLDQDIINSRVTGAAGGFAHSLKSHCVFLAACGLTESAQECGGRGFFTRALLEVLVTCGTDNLTYKDLVRRIPILPGQNPQCEGFFQTRVLFNSKAPGKDRILYKIRRQGQQYVMDAGAVHGITDGAYFDLYQDRESILNGTLLGTLVVLHTDPLTSTLDIILEASGSLPKGGYALRTRIRFEEDLRIHVATNVQLPLTQALASDVEKTPFSHRILLVEKEKADLEFTLEEESVVVNLLDSVVTTLGLTRIPFFIEPNVDVVSTFIRAASHFYWHLRRKSDTQAFHKKIQVEFTEVVQSEEEYDDDLQPIIYPVGPNFNHENIIDIRIQQGKMYGIKIINNSDVALYPFLFFFDNSDFSIVTYYEPPTSDTGKADPPLLPKSSVTIGYGPEGGVPYTYYLRDGQNIDVGYLKLFLFTQPVDLSHVPQSSPFAEVSPSAFHQNDATVKTMPTGDTILIPIIQREGVAH